MAKEYDSRPETEKHIKRVSDLLAECVFNLCKRGDSHDISKLQEPELSIFNEFTPKLKHSTYGSDEYKTFLKDMKPALDNHYSRNRHHPEHFLNGIKDMNLIDLLEMIVDWKSASERHENGDIFKSIEINQERFGYSDELKSILKNTAEWLKDK